MHEQHVGREAAEKTDAQTAGICLSCGRPLTRLGPAGECLRCLVSLAFLPDGEPIGPGIATRRRVVPAPLSYAHFEVEIGVDGFPVELGAGAMAVTYRARDTILHSVVALKVIDRQMAENPAARARFLREARAAAQLHHPNVARVTYYGEQDSECFYVMEFIEGETLEERVRREGPMPLALALEVILQAARALAAAEACGVVHRDIKPSNLMIASRQGEAGASDSLLVKMIDFGVAKVANAGVDQTQAGFIGTPAFASPEQFAGPGQTSVDTRSDIYSLGITFWYLLAGRTPFTGRTLEEIRARQSEEPPLDQLKDVEISVPVIGLLKSMLAIDPAARPQSARELLAAVQRCSKMEQEAPAVFEATARREEGFWVAVLPFKFSGINSEIAVLSEGLNEEIVTGLSRFPYLRVIARSSTSRFIAQSFDVRRVGYELGARYVMEGSLRQAGNKLRMAVQLVDAHSGTHLWAETFDRELQDLDIFELQDEIADRIVATVADVYGVLARAIAATTGTRAPETLTPYEAVWRFFLAQQRGSAEDHLLARIALENAVETSARLPGRLGGAGDRDHRRRSACLQLQAGLTPPRPTCGGARLRYRSCQSNGELCPGRNAIFLRGFGRFSCGGGARAGLKFSLQLHHGAPRPSFLLFGRLGTRPSFSGKGDRSLPSSSRLVPLREFFQRVPATALRRGTGGPPEDQHAGLLGRSLLRGHDSRTTRQSGSRASRSRTNPAPMAEVRADLRDEASGEVVP